MSIFTPFAFFGSSYGNIITTDLIFHLDFSYPACYPGTGTSVYDLAGNNTGSFAGTVSYSSLNNGYLFASGGYVDFGDVGVLDLQFTQFTSQVWWKKLNDPLGGNLGGIYGKMDGPLDRGFAQYQDSGAGNDGSGIEFDFYDQASGGTLESLVGTDVDSNWNFLTFVFDRDAPYQRLYENLTLDVNQTTGVPTLFNGSNGTPFRIFDRGDTIIGTGTEYLANGQIGAVFIYDRALSESEITQNYNNTKIRFS